MDWSVIAINLIAGVVLMDVGFGLLVEWWRREQLLNRASNAAYLMAMNAQPDQFDLCSG